MKWQLLFNVNKCKVLHIGHKNPICSYTMFGHCLASTKQERDLGVLVDGSLRFHSQASSAAAKGNQLLGIVHRAFASLTKTSLPLLYKSLIRPHLEFRTVSGDQCLEATRSLLRKSRGERPSWSQRSDPNPTESVSRT